MNVEIKQHSRKIIKILKESDIYLAHIQLKRIFKKYNELRLNEEALSCLADYIKKYSLHEHIIETGFQRFMSKFVKKICPGSIDQHIRCLAYLEAVDLEYFRQLFSYSKIFQIFKQRVAAIATNETDSKHLSILIRLVNENNLIYKNLLPLISRLKMYITENIVDKNIGTCCSVLCATVEHCPERFNDTLIISIIDYIVKLFYSPQNYLFLAECDVDAIKGALEALCVYPFQEGSRKTNLRGLLKECMGKLAEYRHSTVKEEVLVLTNTMEAMLPILDLCFKEGMTDFSFIDSSLFEAAISNGLEPAPICKSKCDFYELNKKESKSYGHWFAELQKEEVAILKSRYLIAKYLIINKLGQYVDYFDRVSFYNDLLKIQDPIRLFVNLGFLKQKIDWSDLIAYACNSNCKESYIPLIVDSYYTSHPGHITYLEIFIKSTLDSPGVLLYLTKAVVEKGLDSVIISLYLQNVDDGPLDKKRQGIILEYLANYSGSSFSPKDSSDDRFITQIRNSLNKDKKKVTERSRFEAIIEDFLSRASLPTISNSIAALVFIFLARETSTDIQTLLYKFLRGCLKDGNGAEKTRRIYICLCAFILEKTSLNFFDIGPGPNCGTDVLIAFLNYRVSGQEDGYLEKLKSRTTEFFFQLSPEDLSEVGALWGIVHNESIYLQEYLEIKELINLGTKNN